MKPTPPSFGTRLRVRADLIWSDIRHSLLILRKNPLAGSIAILTLALGIGISTGIFSTIDSVMLRALPYPQPDRLLWVSEHFPKLRMPSGVVAADYLDLRDSASSFESLAAYRERDASLTDGDVPERVVVVSASQNLFATFGMKPLIGRVFSAKEDRQGAPKVAVISHALWRARFGQDARALGEFIRVDDTPHQVIGVMRPEATYPDKADVWVPLALDETAQKERKGMTLLNTVGRLKDGLTLQQAASEMRLLTDRIGSIYNSEPKFRMFRGLVFDAVPLKEHFLPDKRLPVMLLGAAGLILLIVCANITNLLLASSLARCHEMAIRSAIGASRGHVIAQLLTECLVLAGIGGVLGVLLASASAKLLVRVIPVQIIAPPEIHLDMRMLMVAGLLSIGAAIVFGIAPAIRFSNVRAQSALRSGRRVSNSRGMRCFRMGLVATELAIAAALLVGVGLLLKSFTNIVYADAGFSTDHLLTFRLSLPQELYRTVEQQQQGLEKMRASIAELPDVQSVAVASVLPLALDGPSGALDIERHPQPGAQLPVVIKGFVNAHYFSTIGMRLTEGRMLSESDTAGTEPVVIINSALARQYFRGENPVGQRIRVGLPTEPWTKVVGIVADARPASLEAAVVPTAYRPITQAGANPLQNMMFAVRTRTESRSVAAAVRQRILAVNRNQSIYDVVSMEQRFADATAFRRLILSLALLFGVTSLFIAAIGVYGVVAEMTTQATTEIAVRMAMGATPASILAMVLRRGALTMAAGLAVGAAGARQVAMLLEPYLYRVRPTDMAVLGSALLLLLGISCAAYIVPAMRAATLDPSGALRRDVG